MSLDQEEIERELKSDVGNNDSGVAKSLSELLDTLSDDQQYKMFSELSDEEIKHLAVISTTGDEVADEFIEQFMTLKVSYNRKGRKELTGVADSLSNIFGVEEGGGLIQSARDRVGL